MQTHITYGAIFLAIAQLPFLFNLVRSFRNGRLAERIRGLRQRWSGSLVSSLRKKLQQRKQSWRFASPVTTATGIIERLFILSGYLSL